ncbi:MAG: SRPBCC domain-containing protein [Devosia sp.]
MPQSFTATKSIVIAASAKRVWEALTDPVQVKQYMFGSDVVTDWKQGSPLIYRGIWKGEPFEDKGTILEIDPPRLLRTNYFSPLSGKPDVPENYAEVTYALSVEGGGTKLTVTQSNISEESGKAQSEGNWSMVQDLIKKLIEG